MSEYAKRRAFLKNQSNQRFNNASGGNNDRAARPSLPDTQRTVKVKVSLVNGDGTIGGKAIIFGGVRHAVNKATSATNNTKVEVVNGSMDEFIASITSGDIVRFGKMRMSIVNDEQAEALMTIRRKKGNSLNETEIAPGDSRSPRDTNLTLLEVEDFGVTLDAYTELEYALDQSVGTKSVIMTFYIEEMIDNAAILKGGEVVKTNYGLTAAQKRDHVLRS